MSGRDDLAAHVQTVMAWELRCAPRVSRLEQAIEWLSLRTRWSVERWEWRTPDGRWIGYWRRNGSLPA